jgi:hypothetical protein
MKKELIQSHMGKKSPWLFAIMKVAGGKIGVPIL